MSKFLDGSGLSYLWTKIKNTFYTKTESDNKYALKTALDNYYDKTTSDEKYALKDSLNNYYQKAETYNQSEINNLIAGVSGGEIDAYTKTESDNRYYQKSEADAKYQVKGNYASTTSHYTATIEGNSALPSINVGQIKSFKVKGSYGDSPVGVLLPPGGTYFVAKGKSSVNASTEFRNIQLEYINMDAVPGGTKIELVRNNTQVQGFYIRLS